jgi:hypothetical protein
MNSNLMSVVLLRVQGFGPLVHDESSIVLRALRYAVVSLARS